MAQSAQGRRIDPIYSVLFYLHWTVVLLALVGPFVALGIGTIEFGHVPKPSINDPSGMGPIAGAVASYLYFLPLLGVFGFGPIGLIVIPVYSVYRWGIRKALVLSVIFTVICVLAFANYLLDPFRIGDWMLD